MPSVSSTSVCRSGLIRNTESAVTKIVIASPNLTNRISSLSFCPNCEGALLAARLFSCGCITDSAIYCEESDHTKDHRDHPYALGDPRVHGQTEEIHLFWKCCVATLSYRERRESGSSDLGTEHPIKAILGRQPTRYSGPRMSVRAVLSALPTLPLRTSGAARCWRPALDSVAVHQGSLLAQLCSLLSQLHLAAVPQGQVIPGTALVHSPHIAVACRCLSRTRNSRVTAWWQGRHSVR
jgi:hypothetical protein